MNLNSKISPDFTPTKIYLNFNKLSVIPFLDELEKLQGIEIGSLTIKFINIHECTEKVDEEYTLERIKNFMSKPVFKHIEHLSILGNGEIQRVIQELSHILTYVKQSLRTYGFLYTQEDLRCVMENSRHLKSLFLQDINVTEIDDLDDSTLNSQAYNQHIAYSIESLNLSGSCAIDHPTSFNQYSLPLWVEKLAKTSLKLSLKTVYIFR